MKLKYLFLSLILFCLSANAADFKYVGGDISLLPTYEEKGSIYKDTDGTKIDNLLPYLSGIGMNAMRVRLFVNPGDFQANHPNDYDPNACQSLPYIIPLCQDITSNGMDLLLDFHYSDTWADPSDQWIPDAWKGLTDDQLAEKVYQYTKDTLLTLQGYGIVPEFIQPGNEISYGMLWAEYGGKKNTVYGSTVNAAWIRFGNFLKAAIKACRECCPNAKIILHTERVAQVGVLTNFYSMMKTLDVDYDIVGLSYYPSYHGQLSMLDTALTSVESQFPDKKIMIVETGYPLYWDLPDASYKLEYPIGTEAAQNQYAQDLVALLLRHENVNGLFWWWLEYNPYGANLSNWWNAPLFDPKTGKATAALKTIASFSAGNAGIDDLDADQSDSLNDDWYLINGLKIQRPSTPGIYIHNGKKVIVTN